MGRILKKGKQQKLALNTTCTEKQISLNPESAVLFNHQLHIKIAAVFQNMCIFSNKIQGYRSAYV